MRDARESRAEAAWQGSEELVSENIFCWADDTVSARGRNVGDATIDTLNMSFLVDGVFLAGFAAQVDGSEVGEWRPDEYAYLNRSGVTTEPDRVLGITGVGTTIHFTHIICPILTSIVVTPATASMDIGDTQEFSATGYDQYGEFLDARPFSWSSDCGTTSLVDSNSADFTAGTVSGICLVTATSGLVSGSATVTIDPDMPATITVAPDDVGVPAGGSQAFTSTALDQYGNVNTTAAIAWTTNGGSINGAGVLTAQTTAQLGRSVTATWDDGTNPPVSGSATVDVYPAAPASALVTPDGAGVTAGGTQAYAVVLTDAYGNVNGTAPVTWSTDAGSISAGGLLTAQTTAALGKSVTATSGAASDSATVDLWPDAPATIVVTPDGAGVPAGGTQAYAAAVYDQYGNLNSTAPVTWSTDGGSIDAAGLLTAQTTAALGKTVTATSGAASDGATVDIWPAVPATALVLPDGAGVTAGGTRSYSATIYDAYGNVNGTAPVSWSTNAGSIDAAGLLTAQTTAASGRSVTATSGAASDSATVDIIADAPSSITVTPAGAGVTVGTTRAYTAVVYDQYGNVNATATVTWSTNGGGISGAGVLTAQTTAATGKTVTASAGVTSGQATVDIIADAPSSALVTPDNVGVAAGGSRAFSVTIYDQYGNVNGTASATWSTNAGSISAGGVLTAQTTAQLGRSVTATIGSVSDSATVDVYAAAPSTISLTPDPTIVNTTLTRQFTAVVYDQYGNVNSTATVSWSATRGSVSATGLYTAPSTTGADTVTATSGTASDQASVSVQRAIHIQSVTMYKANVTASTFVRGTDTAEARAIIVDHLGNAVSGASAQIRWIRPNTNTDHTDTVTTTAAGAARAYWVIPSGANQGTWTARVVALSGTDLWWDTAADATTQATFSVTN